MTRLAKLRASMETLGLDAYVVRHVSDLRWLTGFCGVFDGEAAHVALIMPDSCAIHTDTRYSNALREHAQGSSWEIDDEPVAPSAFIASRLAATRGLRIGIEQDIPLNFYRALRTAFKDCGLSCGIVETKDIVRLLRAVKDAGEIEAHRRAQEATDEAFAHMCEWMAVGMSEAEIRLELDYSLRRLGGGDIAFASIVAAGKNGANAHAVPGSTMVRKGDMLVMDFGAVVDDYRADMTRTVCFGSPGSREREVYDIVRTAHERSAAAIAPGRHGADIHALASDIIDASEYKGLFGHGLGHGVGLDIHEYPNLSPGSEAILELGNVVTVEPGIYLPGSFGVRLEDFGVVTQDGFEPFTRTTHDLVEV